MGKKMENDKNQRNMEINRLFKLSLCYWPWTPKFNFSRILVSGTAASGSPTGTTPAMMEQHQLSSHSHSKTIKPMDTHAQTITIFGILFWLLLTT